MNIDFDAGRIVPAGFRPAARASRTHSGSRSATAAGVHGCLAWSAARFNLTSGGEARYAEGLYVSGEFFRNLGVNPLLGRVFTAEDEGRPAPAPAPCSATRSGSANSAATPGVLGRTVRLDGHTFPVIGVTPPAFFGVEVGNRSTSQFRFAPTA